MTAKGGWCDGGGRRRSRMMNAKGEPVARGSFAPNVAAAAAECNGESGGEPPHSKKDGSATV
jgi:hypothetical protein